MFSKKDYLCFIIATILIAVAYCCMVFDPVEHGFGMLTLWIAPPFLLLGFLLPVGGIVGVEIKHRQRLADAIRRDPYKHIGAAIAFAISLVVYLMTLEPTASLWDCSEFIASAYKLQVPHSPGNPLFILFGRLFSMLAFEDITKVAVALNAMSALFSAFTVFIVFHLIYAFSVAAQITSKYVLLLAASVGSLCLAFSDSFWFSAVEAETYAAASFFLLLLVWLILSGSSLNSEARARRLVLIFYVAALSYCVHPMCLVSLPLLPFYWGTTTKRITVGNFVLTVGLGLMVVIAINRVVAVGFFEALFSVDLFFVNTLHLPFYSGAFAMIAALIILFVFLLRRYAKYGQYTWSMIFLLSGFLPYLMLFIRSNHNPPIDETNPENLALIKAYMNRESYLAAPLVYGPYFDAEIENISVKNKMHYKDSNSYKIAGTTSEYEYDKKRLTIFPRIYSNEENNIDQYRQWTGLKEGEAPTFLDNLEFMCRFQLGEMYFRYFMFNFAGRESDVQYSSWLLPWEKLKGVTPNKARNQYWMIPLALGLAGSFFHWRKQRKDFLAILIFFSVTGWLLALYLNSPPNEPRERDYIYVGSFIAYSIWIGIGTAALASNLNGRKKLLPLLAIITLAVPAWMGYQNFDDHDRSGRTFQMDNSRNLLNSCAPNSILFTGGDNDTFPLWYLQEVEGFRTDVRIMVLSYLNTDWYINQLRHTYYNSLAFKLTLTEKDYLQYGPNDVLYVHESIKEGIDAEKYLELLHEEHPALRMTSSTGEPYSILPSRVLTISGDNTPSGGNRHVSNSGRENRSSIALSVTGNYLTKNSLAILDLLISNNWERPVYFNFTSYNQIDLNVRPYLVQEGLVYRLMPEENLSKDVEPDSGLMFKNLMTNANYENLLRDDIYLNHEDYHARMIEPLRSAFNLLAASLLYEGKVKEAGMVLDKAVYNFYAAHLKPSFANLQTADILLSVGRRQEAHRLSAAVFDSTFLQVKEELDNKEHVGQLSVLLLRRSVDLLNRSGRTEYAGKLKDLNIFD